ncbi:MAG: UDP-N-acetylmuramoyl-tripeptide--D-alanyl-D-alanine ligase [Firmicutes bacterium HGW-Firmicutes-15]|nr:MAG: UDP-N-acetylmuramoyl-tripeptide--D-alanyl-D-alanine ligase [Firmicutes bacterium HGW-Firmicutes-15]
MRLDLDFVVDSVNGIVMAGNQQGWVEGINTDSRKVKPGGLFFALQGENFDGHDFIANVWEAGAAAVVVSRPVEMPTGGKPGAVIMVTDTLEALQNLAGRYRRLFAVPVVAVTGSVGKTTTKDMLADCLAPVYKTLKTPGNFNNEIGLPITLLSMDGEHQAAVVELAMRASGEISNLARIVRPTYAIITNIEPVHLETMKSMENIAHAKCEILEFIAEDKFALINGDNELLLKTASRYPNPKYTFGYRNDCDFQVVQVENDRAGINVGLRIEGNIENIYCPVPARRLAVNLAAAVGMAYMMGVSLEDIKKGLALYEPSGNRLNIINLPTGGSVIDDTYNANPLSMMAALEVCKDISRGRKTVAVLGDMLELGNYEMDGHIQVGKRVAELEMDILVTIGHRAEYIGQGALLNGMPKDRIKHYQSREESLPWLKKHIGQHEVVLFKGSRGMQLEKLVQNWLS